MRVIRSDDTIQCGSSRESTQMLDCLGSAGFGHNNPNKFQPVFTCVKPFGKSQIIRISSYG